MKEGAAGWIKMLETVASPWATRMRGEERRGCRGRGGVYPCLCMHFTFVCAPRLIRAVFSFASILIPGLHFCIYWRIYYHHHYRLPLLVHNMTKAFVSIKHVFQSDTFLICTFWLLYCLDLLTCYSYRCYRYPSLVHSKTKASPNVVHLFLSGLHFLASISSRITLIPILSHYTSTAWQRAIQCLPPLSDWFYCAPFCFGKYSSPISVPGSICPNFYDFWDVMECLTLVVHLLLVIHVWPDKFNYLFLIRRSSMIFVSEAMMITFLSLSVVHGVFSSFSVHCLVFSPNICEAKSFFAAD